MNINIKTGKPERDYNTVLTFPLSEMKHYEPLRINFCIELKAGVEIITEQQCTWKMNLSDEKIDLLVKAVAGFFKKLDKPHGYSWNITAHHHSHSQVKTKQQATPVGCKNCFYEYIANPNGCPQCGSHQYEIVII